MHYNFIVAATAMLKEVLLFIAVTTIASSYGAPVESKNSAEITETTGKYIYNSWHSIKQCVKQLLCVHL